jgi:mRNA interferase MazF
MLRGEVRRSADRRRGEGLCLVTSSDIYNATDVPIVIVAEIVTKQVRDSPVAVPIDEPVVGWIYPDRLSWVPKDWLEESLGRVREGSMAKVEHGMRAVLSL